MFWPEGTLVHGHMRHVSDLESFIIGVGVFVFFGACMWSLGWMRRG
jgi:hypothetical protein